jgi:hypothetical protein
VRGAVESDHERHADLDVHHQGEGQQDDDGVVCGEAGNRSHDDAEEHRRQDHPPEAERVAEELPEEIEPYIHGEEISPRTATAAATRPAL